MLNASTCDNNRSLYAYSNLEKCRSEWQLHCQPDKQSFRRQETHWQCCQYSGSTVHRCTCMEMSSSTSPLQRQRNTQTTTIRGYIGKNLPYSRFVHWVLIDPTFSYFFAIIHCVKNQYLNNHGRLSPSKVIRGGSSTGCRRCSGDSSNSQVSEIRRAG